LALVAALTGEADYVFIPEWPPAADWPVKMCSMLHQASIQLIIIHIATNWASTVVFFAFSQQCYQNQPFFNQMFILFGNFSAALST